MSRRRVATSDGTPQWRWRVADTLNRLGWCWSDLVGWAMPPSSRPLRSVARRSSCAVEPDTLRVGRCYCGQTGPTAPGCRWTDDRGVSRGDDWSIRQFDAPPAEGDEH